MPLKLQADLHTHSVASGHGYSTVLELARAAAAKGLLMIGLTDHGPAMPGGPHLYHFGNLRAIPAVVEGVRVLKGVEANIIDRQGGLDMPPHYLDKMEIVLAGFHEVCSPAGTVEENTAAMLAAMQNPYVDIIVHPGNPHFQVDPEKIVKMSCETGVPLEINNSSFCGSRAGSEDNCREIAKLIARYGAPVVIGSDAHFAEQVGSFAHALAVAEEAGIKPGQILNITVERVLAYLEERRRRRGRTK